MRNENERVNKIKHCWADNALTLKFRTRWGSSLSLICSKCPQSYALVLTAANAKSLSMVLNTLANMFLQQPVKITRNGINRVHQFVRGMHLQHQLLSILILKIQKVWKKKPVCSNFLTDKYSRYLTSNCINCADAINSCCLVLY